jgi:Putative adhesin
MRSLHPSSMFVPAFVLAALAFVPALAAQDWQKSYPVSGKPSLTVNTGDASTEVRPCGDCREVRIRVQWNQRHADDYTINEFQSGSHVNFELKEKQHYGIHVGMAHHEPQVTVETPADIDLEARTSDGALKVSGVQGTISLHTSDGAVEVADVSGAVRLVASDGSIRIHNVTGTLESKSSDGRVTIDGRLSGVQVHTSDGSLDLTLADGSQLTTSSRIEASDGSVKIRLPKTLAADLDIQTSDGHIDCQVPLTMSGYNSGGGHNIRGKLNAGGTPLTIHTSDGNVTIAAL